MKKFTGMIVSAALLLAAQTSMAYDSQVNLSGFSNETDALNAGKQVVQQITDGSYKIPFAELALSCDIPFPTDMQADDVRLEKVWKNGEAGLTETFEAIVNYQYDCENIDVP